jgi:hypothetical protein
VGYDRVVRLVVVCALTGCGFHAHEGPRDGANDVAIDTVVDVAPDTPRASCLPRWMDHTITIDPPVAIAELDSIGYERDPFLSPDGRTIYFSAVRADSQPPTYEDIYTATRTGPGAMFDTPVRFAPGSTTDGYETKISFSTDGHDLVVGSSHMGGEGNVDVWEAVDSGSGFGELQQMKLGAVNDFGSQQDPTISGDGLTLYEAPDTTGTQQILRSTRSDRNHNFSPPAVIDELRDPGGFGTADPAVTADQLIILVASARAGTAGGGDLWYATRATVNDPFSTPIQVPTVNSISNEGDAHLSADGCELFFASDRDAGMNWDLFVSTVH